MWLKYQSMTRVFIFIKIKIEETFECLLALYRCINNGNEIFIINLNRLCIPSFSVHYIWWWWGALLGRGLTMLKRNAHKSIKLWPSVYKRPSPALCPGRQLLSFHRRDFVFIYHHHHYPSGATLPPYRCRAMYNINPRIPVISSEGPRFSHNPMIS